ncbi:MAG: DUF4342 domain-containing protein [Rhodobacteraceae bacterium]|jgi:hypothetical protein|nr:DUF4342 domain-containing protein [Paracoccaceae bacterium]
MTEPEKKDRTIVETIEVAGSELIQRIRDIVAEGNVRRLKVHAGEDFTLEMPVTVGVVMGGVVALAAPWLAVLGVVAALVARVRLEVEREPPPPPPPGAAGPQG